MEEKKLSRREKEKLMHRDQILAVALELFSDKGYHNVSMHEIAGKAEFAIGTIYKFFKNKEDLYKTLMMSRAEEYHRILKDVLSKKDDVLTVLKNYVAAKIKIFADNVAGLALYLAETRGASLNIKAGLDEDIRKLYDELIQKLTSVLESGVRKNLFRKMDPYYMAIALEGVTNSFLFSWLEDRERHPYRKNIPVIMEVFLKGILAG